MTTSRRRLRVILIFLSVSIAACGAWFYWFYTVEDAYISFRYCDYLLSGKGLVFNPGERVEGYSNFLWILVMAPFRLLMEFPLAAKIPGLLLLIIMIILIGQTRFPCDQSHQGKADISGPAAALLTAVSPGIQMWSVAGLETILFSVCIVGGLLIHERKFRLARLASGFCFGLSAITRPEGAWFFVLFLMTHVLLTGIRRSAWWEYVAGFSIAVVPHVIFRVSYYHAWIPNTFWVKSRRFQGGGLQYFKRYLAMTGFWMAPIAGIGLFDRRTRSTILPHMVMAAGYLVYVYSIGGDWMPYGRFLVPIIPVLAIPAARTVSMMRPGSLRKIGIGCLAASVLVAAASTGYDLMRMRPTRYSGILRWEMSRMEQWKTVGRWLSENTSPDWVLCTGLAGIMPYYSGLRTLDRGGLNDRQIARIIYAADDPVVERQRIQDVVLERKPDIVMIEELSFNMLRSEPGIPAELPVPDPDFQSLYTLETFSVGSRYFSCFILADRVKDRSGR